MQFKGFSKKTIEYLHNVRLNNSKIWYEAHREDYKKYVRQPFMDMVEDLTPTVREIDPDLITEPVKCLSRIYRDARFTKDKHLYRDSAWIVFRRPTENNLEGPAFFAEIMRDAVRYGMGAYDSSPKTMAAIRKFIVDSPETFAEAVEPIVKSGLLVCGERYKRLPAGFTERAEQLGLRQWYEMKNFFISSPELPHETFFEPEIVNEIAEKFKATAAFYKLLLEIERNKIVDDGSLPPKNTVQDFEW